MSNVVVSGPATDGRRLRPRQREPIAPFRRFLFWWNTEAVINEGTLHTWQGIEGILHRLSDEQSEPDPWGSLFIAQAIQSVGRGEPNPDALDIAALPATERHAREVDLSAASRLTTADLRAAFDTLPVPGGRPS